jgi:hypothetical protein
MAAVETIEESESSRTLEDLLHAAIREDLEKFEIQGKELQRPKS